MPNSIWRRIVDVGARVLFPEVCAGCGISGAWICSDCVTEVTAIDLSACCQRCGLPSPLTGLACERCDMWPASSVEARSRFVFAGPLRSSVIRMKYHGEFARAEWHAGQLSELLSAAAWLPLDLVVPVPLHPKKLRSRGYNQTEKLAAGLAETTGSELTSVLQRTRDTGSQTTLGRADRWANVAAAFTCPGDVQGRDVLLVDDVLTTGATIHSCARALLDAGASRVRAITLATEI